MKLGIFSCSGHLELPDSFFGHVFCLNAVSCDEKSLQLCRQSSRMPPVQGSRVRVSKGFKGFRVCSEQKSARRSSRY